MAQSASGRLQASSFDGFDIPRDGRRHWAGVALQTSADVKARALSGQDLSKSTTDMAYCTQSAGQADILKLGRAQS